MERAGEKLNQRAPVPYGLPKEELFSLLSSESMSDFVVACEALSVLPDEDVCDRLGAYLTSPTSTAVSPF